MEHSVCPGFPNFFAPGLIVRYWHLWTSYCESYIYPQPSGGMGQSATGWVQQEPHWLQEPVRPGTVKSSVIVPCVGVTICTVPDTARFPAVKMDVGIFTASSGEFTSAPTTGNHIKRIFRRVHVCPHNGQPYQTAIGPLQPYFPQFLILMVFLCVSLCQRAHPEAEVQTRWKTPKMYSGC
jgi:hypothetical protein